MTDDANTGKMTYEPGGAFAFTGYHSSIAPMKLEAPLPAFRQNGDVIEQAWSVESGCSRFYEWRPIPKVGEEHEFYPGLNL